MTNKLKEYFPMIRTRKEILIRKYIRSKTRTTAEPVFETRRKDKRVLPKIRTLCRCKAYIY